jgi:hypothetical protein
VKYVFKTNIAHVKTNVVCCITEFSCYVHSSSFLFFVFLLCTVAMHRCILVSGYSCSDRIYLILMSFSFASYIFSRFDVLPLRCWLCSLVGECLSMSSFRCAIFSRIRKISKSDYYLCHVCPYVRMELESHLTDFHEIWYLTIFRKYKGYQKMYTHINP